MIHQTGPETVAGFVAIHANDMDEAAAIMKGCPIYEFNGYAEIRKSENRN